MKITTEYLEAHNACPEQVELFDKTFPEGTSITRKACLAAGKAGLNLDWLAGRLFDEQTYDAYTEAAASAFKAYAKARASADKAYREACAVPFYKAYKGMK